MSITAQLGRPAAGELADTDTDDADEGGRGRAIVPAGPGDHWATIAAYLNEPDDDDDDDAERIEGEPVNGAPLTVDATARDVTPGKPGTPPGPLGEAGQRIRAAYLKTAELPTPGGIGGLIFALVVFGMAIIPVGPTGETRLQLIWGTLTGTVSIPSKYDTRQAAIDNLISSGNPLGGVPIIGGIITGIAGGIDQGLHNIGIGAGPDGMPGYGQSDANQAIGGGLDGFSRLY